MMGQLAATLFQKSLGLFSMVKMRLGLEEGVGLTAKGLRLAIEGGLRLLTFDFGLTNVSDQANDVRNGQEYHVVTLVVSDIGRTDIRTGRIDDVEEPPGIAIGTLYHFDPRGLDKKSSGNSLLTLPRDSTTSSTPRNMCTSHSRRTI